MSSQGESHRKSGLDVKGYVDAIGPAARLTVGDIKGTYLN